MGEDVAKLDSDKGLLCFPSLLWRVHREFSICDNLKFIILMSYQICISFIISYENHFMICSLVPLSGATMSTRGI